MKIIDADALIEEIQYYIDEAGWSIAHNEALNWCIEFIEHSPTVEERKPGKWIDNSDGIEGAWNYCSVCGEQAIDLYDFCPNCGAKMEG